MARVPQPDTEFNDYINGTTDYLQITPSGSSIVNWDRLGLTSSENNQWKAFRNNWNDTYGIIVENNTKGIRDSSAIADKNEAKDDFTDWVTDPLQNKLDRIAASADITNQDREVFNIKVRDDNRTVLTAPIEEPVDLSLKPLGGGDMRVRARYDTDETRASIPEGAKAVELCYIIGTTAPESVADCTESHISTKALFTFNVGAENHNKNIYCYARWIDTSNPNRAGSWTDQVVTGVL